MVGGRGGIITLRHKDVAEVFQARRQRRTVGSEPLAERQGSAQISFAFLQVAARLRQNTDSVERACKRQALGSELLPYRQDPCDDLHASFKIAAITSLATD